MLQTAITPRDAEVPIFVLVPYTGQEKKARKKRITQHAPNLTTASAVLPYVQLTLDLVERAIAKLVEPIAPRLHFVPAAYRSDKAYVALVGHELTDEGCDADIPYEPWGSAWVVDANGLAWSAEAVQFLRIRVFWESLDELALKNNEREKWDVLKWMFKPVFRRLYVYGRPPVEWHENDEPFSFHNCCNAVGMDEEIIRDGMRRHVDPEIITAVERVCSY